MSLATLSVWQPHDSALIRDILSQCRPLTYNAIQYAESNRINNRGQMNGFYRSIRDVDLPSSFKVAVITRACAVLRSRWKSDRRGVRVRHRTPLKLAACIVRGFFVTVTGKLFVSLGHHTFEMVQLNTYAFSKVSKPGVKMRSLTLTEDRVAICYSSEVESIEPRLVIGVDRNEKNLTYGDRGGFEEIDLSRIVKVKQTTREILGSFKRDDMRIRRLLAQKYWKRANDKTTQILHLATNQIVESARSIGAAMALEDISGINKMYRKGNGKGRDYRFRMNAWPHRRQYEMLGYKAAIRGVTVIKLTKAETRGSSSIHSACGEKLRRPARGDLRHKRHLWCGRCKVWVHRDGNAVANLADRGLSRLASSLHPPSQEEAKGPACEAMNGNPATTVIPGADARQVGSKASLAEELTEPEEIDRNRVSPLRAGILSGCLASCRSEATGG